MRRFLRKLALINTSLTRESSTLQPPAIRDLAGACYPSASPNVVSVGGTCFNRDGNGNFTSEQYYTGGGGGDISPYEPRPSYQNGIAGIVGNYRGYPDVASDYCCAAIYLNGGWGSVGGTSWSSPTFAGIVNAAGSSTTVVLGAAHHDVQRAGQSHRSTVLISTTSRPVIRVAKLVGTCAPASVPPRLTSASNQRGSRIAGSIWSRRGPLERLTHRHRTEHSACDAPFELQ